MAEMNNTVSDVIGGEYQKWKPNDKIFISSPTGTGKTYFILNVLLPYAYQKEKQILYLVNRRILKQQLERELSRELFEVRYHIKIELYQTIEKRMSNIRYNIQNKCQQAMGYRSVLLEFENYDYVICDECHYFLADSNYNTNTGLSFRCIQDIFSFSNKIRIFLSATICNVKDYIISDDEKRLFQRTFYYGFHWKNTIGVNRANKGKEWNYETPCNYDYLDIHIINREDEISDLVMNGNGKWLIFVDSINLGKELQEALRNKWKHSDDEADKKVIMLSSDYAEESESAQEVYSIQKDNRQSAKVLISTSVMDNGISLIDIQLRNIILIADTEVEFMQMLGRKRKDKERVNLYIYRQSRVHFLNRQSKIMKMREAAEKYWGDAKKYVETPVKECLKLGGEVNWVYLQSLEWRFIEEKHKQIMQDIANKQIEITDVNGVFNVYDGRYYLNRLSMRQIEILFQYYDKILKNFDYDGEDAFLKEQLRWLGKSEEEIGDIIARSKISRKEKSRQTVLEKFEEIQNTEMDKEKAVVFKKEVRADLLVLVQGIDESNTEKEKVTESLKKNDRPISKENMEFLRKYCNLPYEMVVEKASGSSGKKESTYVVRGALE